jgi:hypothetical protein
VKLFKVILENGTSQLVPADDYQEIDGEYRFFANGQPVSEAFFVAAVVFGITVENENYDPDAWNRFVRENQEPEATYGDPY